MLELLFATKKFGSMIEKLSNQKLFSSKMNAAERALRGGGDDVLYYGDVMLQSSENPPGNFNPFYASKVYSSKH